MGSVNKVILVGHLGRDPEIRAMQSGDKVCNLSVATSERWQKNGQTQEKTEWHRVVLFDQKLIEVAEKYLKKGSKVYLEGQLQTRKWADQSGTEKFSTEVVLQRFRGVLVMLDSPARQEQSAPQQSRPLPPAEGAGALDDEIPFSSA